MPAKNMSSQEFLSEMAGHLGAPYRLCSDHSFAWLTPFLEDAHLPHARMAHYALARLAEMIPGLHTTPPVGGWPAILLADVDTQLRYNGLFGGTGEHIISGGTYRSYPVGHLAIPVGRADALDAAFAHEMVHAVLSPRGVPGWIQEGIACEVETRLGNRSPPFRDARKLREAIDFWRSRDTATFWNSQAFGAPESVSHTYLLAQIIAGRWTRDPTAMERLCSLGPEDWADQSAAIGMDREKLFRSVVDPQRSQRWIDRVLYSLFDAE